MLKLESTVTLTSLQKPAAHLTALLAGQSRASNTASPLPATHFFRQSDNTITTDSLNGIIVILVIQQRIPNPETLTWAPQPITIYDCLIVSHLNNTIVIFCSHDLFSVSSSTLR